jgi:hypothetical protein
MYGFRIVGNTKQRRILVDADKALAAYAACDPAANLESEAYLSAFVFGEDFATFLRGTGGFTKGYDGPCSARFIHWDVDRTDLNEALTDARRLAVAIRHYGEPLIFYSGSKGFHLDLAVSFEASPIYNQVAKAFALMAAKDITIDRGVFDKVRPFRAPNSRHPKTGRFKVNLTFDELTSLDLDAIQALASQPRPFELPSSALTEHPDWQAAIAEVQQQAEANQVRSDARLNQLTCEFICKGATEGDRHRLLFSAAANLAEFGCPPALAHALLTEPALDTGLPPRDVKRQIECGLSYRRSVNVA